MCIQNLTIIESDLDGTMGIVNLTEYDRWSWGNIDDPVYWWYFRAAGSTLNWVYSFLGASDRIACAPGYVEMPLFCTVFVYAGDKDDYSYTFKIGTCEDTEAPTTEPTTEPTTNEPTTPTTDPTTNEPTTPTIVPTTVPTTDPTIAPTLTIMSSSSTQITTSNDKPGAQNDSNDPSRNVIIALGAMIALLLN